MADLDDAPDPIDEAYRQAEAGLEDADARAARRGRVLAAVEAAPRAGTGWRPGRWLAAASVVGLAVVVAWQMRTPDIRHPPTAPEPALSAALTESPPVRPEPGKPLPPPKFAPPAVMAPPAVIPLAPSVPVAVPAPVPPPPLSQPRPAVSPADADVALEAPKRALTLQARPAAALKPAAPPRPRPQRPSRLSASWSPRWSPPPSNRETAPIPAPRCAPPPATEI